MLLRLELVTVGASRELSHHNQQFKVLIRQSQGATNNSDVSRVPRVPAARVGRPGASLVLNQTLIFMSFPLNLHNLMINTGPQWAARHPDEIRVYVASSRLINWFGRAGTGGSLLFSAKGWADLKSNGLPLKTVYVLSYLSTSTADFFVQFAHDIYETACMAL